MSYVQQKQNQKATSRPSIAPVASTKKIIHLSVQTEWVLVVTGSDAIAKSRVEASVETMARHEVIFELAKHAHPSWYHSLLEWSTPALKKLLIYYVESKQEDRITTN